MNIQENLIKRNDKIIYSNKRKENVGPNRNYDRISAINTPLTKKMLTDIKVDNQINKIESNAGCLIYKSIFNSIEKNLNKDNINNITDQNIKILQDKRKNYVSNASNKKLNKNQKYTINLKKQLQNSPNETPQKNNGDIYNNINKINNNENIAGNFINITGGTLSNDIKYQKQYSANINSNNKSNEYYKNYMNENKKILKYQKSEDNLNKNGIIDKNEFIKKIKEINDLDFLEDNKNNLYNQTEIFSEKELLNNHELLKEKNYNTKKYNMNNRNAITGRDQKNLNLILPNNKNESNINKIKSPQSSFISTTNNSYLNNINSTKTIYNNNLANNKYKNKRNINKAREKIYMNNLSNFENNLDDNQIHLSQITSKSNFSKKQKTHLNLDNNANSYYNKQLLSNNNNIPQEIDKQNYYSTLSNVNNERSYSNNKQIKNYKNNNPNNKNIDILIQNKIQNYSNLNNNINSFATNIDNLTNEFSKSMGSNNFNAKNIKANNLSNISDNLNFTEIQNLKKELKQKNLIIDKYSKIINEYKIKNDNLLEKIKQIQENSKTKQMSLLEQIKEYQKEVYNLKNNINSLKKNSEFNSENENYNNNIYNYTDYIKQINELKDELEKYKKENNNLKILVIKYKNNNTKTNDNFNQTYILENSRNRFNSDKISEKKYNKKSYSVSKAKKRIRASSLSKKNFEEGDLDIPSDNNHVSSFILY